MTGKAAQADGWIDEVIDGEDPDMSLSSDRTAMTVNGITMSVATFTNLPGDIPVVNSATPTPAPPAPAPVLDANKKTKPNKEAKKMTLEELRQSDPELVQQIQASAQSDARTQAVNDERARLQAIQEIAASVGDPEIVREAMYGEKACTAEQLALRAMQKQAQLGQQHIQNQTADFQASGAANVTATPNGGNPAPAGKTEDAEMTEEEAIAMIAGTPAPNKEGK